MTGGGGAFIFWLMGSGLVLSLLWIRREVINAPVGEEIPGVGLVLQDSTAPALDSGGGDRATPGTFADQELCPVANDFPSFHSQEVSEQ